MHNVDTFRTNKGKCDSDWPYTIHIVLDHLPSVYTGELRSVPPRPKLSLVHPRS